MATQQVEENETRSVIIKIRIDTTFGGKQEIWDGAAVNGSYQAVEHFQSVSLWALVEHGKQGVQSVLQKLNQRQKGFFFINISTRNIYTICLKAKPFHSIRINCDFQFFYHFWLRCARAKLFTFPKKQKEGQGLEGICKRIYFTLTISVPSMSFSLDKPSMIRSGWVLHFSKSNMSPADWGDEGD